MQSSRDSSLWRSLAVAFGDGLAFGVGMKLTQAAGRQLTAPPSSAPPRSDPNPLAGRIDQIEQDLKRIERVERPPVTGAGAVDQKVLEAIVNALEARLSEHSGHVDRRLADLEARLAIELRSLDQQDHSIAKRVSEDIAALQKQMVGLNREFGEAVAVIVADQVGSQVKAHAAISEQALPGRIALAVNSAMEPRLAEERREFQESLAALVAGQVASQVEARVAAWEQALPARIALAIQAAVEPRLAAERRQLQDSLAALVAEQVASQVQARAAMLEESLAGKVAAAVESEVGKAAPAMVEPLEQQLRAEMAQKDREIAELQQRLADTDTNVMELILGIGQICRQAATRLGPSEAPPEPANSTVEPPGPAPEPPNVGGGLAEQLSEPASGPGPSEAGGGDADPESHDEPPLPGFAQSQRPNRLWRVPLVSSFVLATGALVFRHFLY